MKKFLILAFIFTSFKGFSQRGSVLYLELLGNGYPYSLNFDAPFKKENTTWGYRLGLGYSANKAPTLQAPLMVNFVRGEKHSLEIGIGLYNTFQSVNSRISLTSFPTGTVMYRFQGEGGLLFRAGWSPILVPVAQGATIGSWFIYMPGISFGYRL